MFDHRNTPGHMEVTTTAAASGADDLWALLATPALWPRWAPHIRRATTESETSVRTVRTGDMIRIDSWGPGYVTAAITHVDEPNRWDFRVDLPLGHHIAASHEVLREPRAVRVVMRLWGPLPGPLGSAMLTAYRPLAAHALRRLVALADAGPT